MSVENVYVKCDVLENLPSLNRDNYNFETAYLIDALPFGAKVLQVGSMDGMRIIRLKQQRPDLHLTGLEIEQKLVNLAIQNAADAGIDAEFICGDITDPASDLPSSSKFDWAMCLNHTLGYIPDEQSAITEMKAFAANVVVSVLEAERIDTPEPLRSKLRSCPFSS